MQLEMLRKTKRGRAWWFILTLLSALLLLSSCGLAGAASSSLNRHSALGTRLDATVSVDKNAPEDPPFSDQFLQHQEYWGADGWIWRVKLPYNRLVVFYGNPYSAPMGPIGQYPDDELIAKLQEQAQAYAQLDPSHPVVPALDYVTPIVQPVPMKDGSWVYRMPDASISHYITLANSNHALFFFDMQVGHSTVQKEVMNLWSYLQLPGVDLSLDPEFDMAPGEIPDVEFGHMSAAEINWAIDQLSQLVLTEHLPPKILIIHRFLEEMLPDWQKIRPQPGVQVIITVDGFGPPGSKIDDYESFDKQELLPFEFPGLKLFYQLDKPLMSPADVLGLDPPPLMVMYQ